MCHLLLYSKEHDNTCVIRLRMDEGIQNDGEHLPVQICCKTIYNTGHFLYEHLKSLKMIRIIEWNIFVLIILIITVSFNIHYLVMGFYAIPS